MASSECQTLHPTVPLGLTLLDICCVCPVRALSALLQSTKLPLDPPLFANYYPPYSQIIDTHVQDVFKKVLTHRNTPHTFKISGMTFDIDLQNMTAHGL